MKTILNMSCIILALVIISIQPFVQATYPGLNGKIVFQRGPPTGPIQIYTMNADGNEVTQLTIIGSNTYPHWSPNGKKIVFVSDRTGNPEIFVMNADGSHQTRLTNNPAIDKEPFWSPDGKKIAFTSNRVYGTWGNGAIFMMNADGSNVKQFTTDGVFYGPFSWSPDGTKIVATSNVEGPIYYCINIQLIEVTHGHCGSITQLTYTHGCNSHPCWSPDGTEIVFDSSRDGSRNIYVMNADGSSQIRLNDVTGWAPCWSPDGEKIAFVQSGNICVMNADGTGIIQLTNGFNDNYPDWQPLRH